MNRQDFGRWGIELKTETFAKSLAFLLRDSFEETPNDIIAKLIGVKNTARIHKRSKTEENNLIQLCLDSTYHSELFSLNTAALDFSISWATLLQDLKKKHKIEEQKKAKRSNYRLQPKNFNLRLELITNPENAHWLSEQLAKVDNQVSIYLRVDEPQIEIGWNWALRVGFLKDENSKNLREELEAYIEKERNWLRSLVEFVYLDSENDSCDLLLIPENLRSALNLALNIKIKMSADCVLMIGQTNENPDDIPALISAFRRFITTSGVGIIKVEPTLRTIWFTELIRELSHNEPIDVALFAASRNSKTPLPFLIASRQLIEFSKLAESIKSLGAKIINNPSEELVDISNEDARNFGVERGLVQLEKLGRIFTNRFNYFRYDKESSSAKSAAKINEILKRSSAAKKPQESQTRWIQAQVNDLSIPNELNRLRRALRANAPHEVVIRIGLNSEDWEQSSEKFRGETLPPDKESYKLTVILTEPQLFTEAQMKTITLPSQGNSSECQFFFHVGEGIKKIEARISILYKNRVLQTALLKAKVSTNPTEVSEDFKIELNREAIVRADFNGLKERRYFDAAFILNEDVNNEPRVTAISDQYVSFSTPEGLEGFNKQVDRFIQEVADSSKDFARKLDDPKMVKLLGNLAKYGNRLYKSLIENQIWSPLADKLIGQSENDVIGNNPKRIQIISAKPDTRLPFEFLYERPSPVGEQVKLCPKAILGLEQGKCFTDCEGLKNPQDYVCPLGFWGLSNIIERHTHSIFYSSTRSKDGSDFRFQAEPVENRKCLEVFRKVLFAASNKADVLEQPTVDGKTEIIKGGVEKISSALSIITKSSLSKISSWDEWKKQIKSGSPPSALILLTHTKTMNSGILALEIEDGSQADMLLEAIEPEYVHLTKEYPQPIVLLIGCETGKAKIDFMNFIASFRQSGAAIIVTTGISILGRHAVPITSELLEILNLYSKEPNHSFGEVMRLVKQKMLARGFPTVLTLMTYGDADWQIGKVEK